MPGTREARITEIPWQLPIRSQNYLLFGEHNLRSMVFTKRCDYDNEARGLWCRWFYSISSSRAVQLTDEVWQYPPVREGVKCWLFNNILWRLFGGNRYSWKIIQNIELMSLKSKSRWDNIIQLLYSSSNIEYNLFNSYFNLRIDNILIYVYNNILLHIM